MCRSVTAVIPAFNCAHWLAESIESVLTQTHPSVQCVVIDDGSTDATPDIARSFGSEIVYLRTQNQGVSRARNAGVRAGSGDLVAFLDADDMWLPKKIAYQVEVFNERPSVALVYTGIHLVDAGGRFIGRMSAVEPERALRNTLLLEKPYIPTISSTGMIPRAVFQRIGGFDENLSNAADRDLACRIGLDHEVARVDRPLVLYRQHMGQMHRDPALMEADVSRMLDKLIHRSGFPARSRRRAFANLYVSVAGAHLKLGDKRRFLRHLARASVTDPARIFAAAWRFVRPGGPPD